MVRTVKMEQDCQVGKPMPAADPNLTSPDNHHDLTASAREEVGSTKENEGDSTHMDQSNAQEKPVMKTKMEPSSTKLCGYLNKLGGPLKAWKARWFVFEEKKCQLYYYRTSQDVNPLGSIDLANATFGYPDQAQEGTFQIQIPGRVVVLKALNSQAMLYWLQQLQIKRWQHNTSLVKIPAEPSTTSTQLCQLPSAPWEGRTEDFLPAVKTPKGLVGEAAASARPLATKCTAKALPQAPHHRDTVYGRDISASKEKLGLNRGMANGLNGGMANGLPQMPQGVSGVPLLVFQQPGVPNGQQGQTGLPLTPQLNPNQLPQQALDMPQLQGQLLQLPNGMLTQLGFPQQPGVGLQYYVVLPQSNPAGVQQPMNPVQQQVQLQGLPVNVGNCIQQQAIAQAAAVAQAQAQAAVKRVKHSASGMAHPVGENVAPERTIQTLPVIEALEPVPGTGMPAVTGEETQVSSGSIATGPALTGEALNPFSV